jgi:hypothetical protein
VRAFSVITRTPMSCNGDECDADSLSLLMHTHIHKHASMHFCLFTFLSIPDSWWPDSDSLTLLMHSCIPTCILVCLCMCIFDLFVLFCGVHLTDGCLTLCFSSIQAPWFGRQPVVGPATGHFRRASLALVSIFFSSG